MRTGFDRWWFGSISSSKPQGAISFWPISAGVTAPTAVLLAFSTACVHIRKPV